MKNKKPTRQYRQFKMTLEVKEYFAQYKGTPGIYAILEDDRIVYIGETNDLNRRLGQHAHFIEQIAVYGDNIPLNDGHSKYYLLADAMNKGHRVHFQVIETLPLANKAILHRREKDWIMTYKPIYNEEVPEKLEDERSRYYNRQLKHQANLARQRLADPFSKWKQ